jgi:hypothetical protein
MVGTIAGACAPRSAAHAPAPTTTVRFRVLGSAAPADTGQPRVRSAERVVTIRGQGLQPEGGGLYGDVDLSEPGILRLTLYDSLPGRAVKDLALATPRRPVAYQAEIGPLPPGTYEVWVGRYDASRNLVEVPPEPVRVRVGPAGQGAEAGKDQTSAAARSRGRATYCLSTWWHTDTRWFSMARREVY